MTDEDRKAEAVLDARIMLEKGVNHPSEGWQKRYCESIQRIALYFGITEHDLSRAWCFHIGPGMNS